MSETPIAISNLNDYVFCPVSIYFHSLDYDTDTLTFQDSYQINGTAAHKAVDSSAYSDKKIYYVYIFQLSNTCKVQKFGFATN